MVTVAAAPQAMVTATSKSADNAWSPNPPSPFDAAPGQRRQPRNSVKAELWRTQSKCAVCAITFTSALPSDVKWLSMDRLTFG